MMGIIQPERESSITFKEIKDFYINAPAHLIHEKLFMRHIKKTNIKSLHKTHPTQDTYSPYY